MEPYSISYSTELIRNYLRAEVLEPGGKLQALQSANGTSLLFSIGTDNVLYGIAEAPKTPEGWRKTDLSSAQVKRDFQGKGGVVCRDFTAVQDRAATGPSIDLAMVLNDGQNDFLYLCLGNSSSDTSWISAPQWRAYPFDAQDINYPLGAKISALLLSESSDANYVVVHLTAPEPAQHTDRYYIDSKKTDGTAWHPQYVGSGFGHGADDWGFGLEAIHSCLGRDKSDSIDGVYSSGFGPGGSQKIVYRPLALSQSHDSDENSEWGAGHSETGKDTSFLHDPAITFDLLTQSVPSAIAACRHADNSTTPYVVAGDSLFSPTEAATSYPAKPILTDPILNGVKDLFAFEWVEGETVTVMVWGLSGDRVFYTQSPPSQATSDGKWSVPMTILSGVEMVSPYVNRSNSASTFFAYVGANRLVKATKSPNTTIWSFRDITLPPMDRSAPAYRFNSYTTRLQVLDGNNVPARNVTASLTAKQPTVAYVNSVYHVIDSEPVEVSTDDLGSLTIVEPVSDLSGTEMTVTVGQAAQSLTPTNAPFARVGPLASVDTLKDAVIHYSDGTSKVLVPENADPADVKKVADVNQELLKAYGKFSAEKKTLDATPPVSPTERLSGVGAVVHADFSPGPGSTQSFTSDIGDLLSWVSALGDDIDRELKESIQVAEDTTRGVWNFAIKIGGRSFTAVLDGVEKVAAALGYLFEVLETDIKDLLDYLSFVFERDDIQRTKDVLANVVIQYSRDCVNRIAGFKAEFDQGISDAKSVIGGSKPDWTQMDGNQPVGSASDASLLKNSAGSLMMRHFQDHAGDYYYATGTTELDETDAMAELIQVLNEEADTIVKAFDGIKGIAGNFASKPLQESANDLAEIVGDATLDSAQRVVDVLFDLLEETASKALDAFEKPVSIPVVSDMLADMGVPSFSLLDVVCWMTAIPTTVSWKAQGHGALFPDNPETDSLTSAQDWETLVSALTGGSSQAVTGLSSAPVIREAASAQLADTQAKVTEAQSRPPSDAAKAYFVLGHTVAGICSTLSAFVTTSEAIQPADNSLSKPSAALGFVGGVAGGVANLLVPQDPIQNSVVAKLSQLGTFIRVILKIFSAIASGVVKKALQKAEIKAIDSRGVFAVADGILALAAMAFSGYHYSELSKASDSLARKNAIVEEASALCSCVARVCYTLAVTTRDKEYTPAAMATTNIIAGGLQLAEAGNGPG